MATAKRKPTAAQLAARKLFAERARAGTLKRNPTRKKRRGPDKVNAPSQLTGKKPTARLKTRRKKNTRAGVFPNPVKTSYYKPDGFKYKVQVLKSKTIEEGKWQTLATFMEKERAHEYAKALSKTKSYRAIRVFWK